jgi:dipeptidyl-peptidase-3
MRPYQLEQIDDAAVVQLYADGFTALSRDDKVLVWHLSLAALAGRDIYYDQRYRHNLAMRDILEEILAHATGIPANTLEELTRYTKLFWINRTVQHPHRAQVRADAAGARSGRSCANRAEKWGALSSRARGDRGSAHRSPRADVL